MLQFRGTPDLPTVLYHVNYHGMHYHYTGHHPECRLRSEGQDPYQLDAETKRLDEFREGLALWMSELEPENLLVRYRTLTACQLFHLDRELNLEEYVERSLGKYSCLPRAYSLWRKSWHVDHLVEKILEGEVTGFVTLNGGSEDEAKGNVLERNFGFCVQKKRPSVCDLSDFTLRQIVARERIEDTQHLRAFLKKSPERTLAARSFSAETGGETISTTYFCWLVRERGLRDYKITHFIQYKFSDYSKDFLEPILERRHRYKREGMTVGAETLKLVANGSFGYTALESSNYDTTLYKTDVSLSKTRKRLASSLSMKNASFVGVVKFKQATRNRGRPPEAKRRRRQFEDEEAEESAGENSEAEKKEEEEDALGLDLSVLTRAAGSEDEDSEMSNEELDGDLEEALLAEAKSVPTCNYKFLFLVTVSGKYKRINNCISRAVSILSNSKKIFLGLVLGLLRQADPALVEPVYCDTDSIILSCTHKRLEDNLVEGGEERLLEAKVIGSEDSVTSIHGKLKLEGTFTAGSFRALKVYRLFSSEQLAETEEEADPMYPDMSQLSTVYTRCKGISRGLANVVETREFGPSLDFSSEILQAYKASLRPTRAAEMVIQLERKSLAQPYNYKRKVDEDGIHSLPFN